MSKLNIGCLYRIRTGLNQSGFYHANGIILAEAFYNARYGKIFIYFNEKYFTTHVKEIETFNIVIEKRSIIKQKKNIRRIINESITSEIKRKVLQKVPYEEYKKYHDMIWSK